MTLPRLRPNSAGYVAPSTLNSWIASTDGKTEMPTPPVTVGNVAVTPSTSVSLLRGRAPLIV